MTPIKSERRSFFKKMAGAAAAASFWSDDTLDAAVQNVNKDSNPSQLKITDLRCAIVTRAPMTDTIIRIDTNQGIYGLGEVRDGSSARYAVVRADRRMESGPLERPPLEHVQGRPETLGVSFT